MEQTHAGGELGFQLAVAEGHRRPEILQGLSVAAQMLQAQTQPITRLGVVWEEFGEPRKAGDGNIETAKLGMNVTAGGVNFRQIVFPGNRFGAIQLFQRLFLLTLQMQ